MTNSSRLFPTILRSFQQTTLPLAMLCVVWMLASQPAQAQNFSTLFNFSLQSGWDPYSGVTRDAAGNLYGTTSGSGYDPGTVFELKKSHGNWVMYTLFTFNGATGSNGSVGYYPWSGVIFGPDGALYGTTFGGGVGGGSNGYGVVYRLTPPSTVCRTVMCPWTETVLYEFLGGSDGSAPALGNVVFDHAGNLYGTTSGGGEHGQGTVFELTPSNGSWTEKVLYSFMGGSDGSDPYGTLVLDSAGNIYGTTVGGGGSGCYQGQGCGTAFELRPSGSNWSETVLYRFQDSSDGAEPFGGLVFDPSGNLYGSTNQGGSAGGGTVFELSPMNGGWNFLLLYSLGPDLFGLGGPTSSLTIDGAGSLFGATTGDGNAGVGTVFKLTPRNGSWSYTLLHTFDNGPDGGEPYGGPVVDAMGNVYGAGSTGGTQSCSFEVQCGVVWEITP